MKQERIIYGSTLDKGFVDEIASDPHCKEIYNCTQCGVCTGACPLSLYGSCIPRKIIAMTREGFKNEALEALDKCLLCGQCQMFCPADLNIKEVLLKLREVSFRLGKVHEGLMFVNGLLCDSFNPCNQPAATRTEWIKSTSLREFASKGKSRIAYWVGCMASYMAPEVARSIAKLLTKLNEDWTLLDDEWCCGMPLRYIGNTEKAIEFANHNVEEIEKKEVDVVIAGCPTCWHVLKFRYPELLQRDFRFKVMHITEYIIDQLNSKKIEISKKLSERVTYHDPCDLARYSMTNLPREILGKMTENFVEMPLHGKDGICCGGGGLFEVVDPELRSTISTQRIKQAEAIGAEILVTACAGCKFFLSQAAERAKSKVAVKYLTELLSLCI